MCYCIIIPRERERENTPVNFDILPSFNRNILYRDAARDSILSRCIRALPSHRTYTEYTFSPHVSAREGQAINFICWLNCSLTHPALRCCRYGLRKTRTAFNGGGFIHVVLHEHLLDSRIIVDLQNDKFVKTKKVNRLLRNITLMKMQKLFRHYSLH